MSETAPKESWAKRLGIKNPPKNRNRVKVSSPASHHFAAFKKRAKKRQRHNSNWLIKKEIRTARLKGA